MHMFKKCASPPAPRRGLVILYGLWLWLSTKRAGQKNKNRERVLMFDFIYLFIFIFLLFQFHEGLQRRSPEEKQNRKDWCYILLLHFWRHTLLWTFTACSLTQHKTLKETVHPKMIILSFTQTFYMQLFSIKREQMWLLKEEEQNWCIVNVLFAADLCFWSVCCI